MPELNVWGKDFIQASTRAHEAAEWWANHLRADHAPSRDTLVTPAPQEFHDWILASFPAELAQELVINSINQGAKVPNFSVEQADAFEKKLFGVFMLAIRRQYNTPTGWNNGCPVVTGIDFDLDVYLKDAGRRSGIITIDKHNGELLSYLPVKTTMWIFPEEILVEEGVHDTRHKI